SMKRASVRRDRWWIRVRSRGFVGGVERWIVPVSANLRPQPGVKGTSVSRQLPNDPGCAGGLARTEHIRTTGLTGIISTGTWRWSRRYAGALVIADHEPVSLWRLTTRRSPHES